MRARIGIVVLVGGIVCFMAVSMYVDAVKARANTNSFERYYEPYEPEISLNFTDYQLPLDINDIVNFTEANKVIDVTSVSDLICQNGFAVKNIIFFSPIIDLFDIYKMIKEGFGLTNLPIFITADTGLDLYHTIFSQTLRGIEERFFIEDIKDLTKELLEDALEKHNQLDGDLKEVAARNVAYLSVAHKLIDPDAAVPDFVNNVVSSELAKIEAHQGVIRSDIFLYAEDYSQYVPRGHYTRSDELKRYFKTMMWCGRMAFLLKGGPEELISEENARIQTMQACMLAVSLKDIQIGGRVGLDVWDRIYTVTSFFVGLADDLTPRDYLLAIEKVFGDWFNLSDLLNEEKLFELKKELALLPSPKIYGGTGDITVSGPITDETLDKFLDKTKGMHLMGRRFVPDSYIFGHLTYPEVGGYTGEMNRKPFTADNSYGKRSYIRGLDLMAVLGSSEAMNILIDEGDTDFNDYDRRFNELTEEFDSLSLEELNQNLYWSWLYCLGGLLEELPEGYPIFMRTRTWHRSRLNTALASWTQLRHDTILYAKSVSPPPPAGRLGVPPPGYVEPNPVFWGRLLSLTRMTFRGLEEFDVLAQNEREKLVVLENLLQKMLEIVKKQLGNIELSSEDRKFFEELPDILKSVFVNEDRQTFGSTLIADVHTFSLEQMVVEEAVGFVDLIVVACPLGDGKAFLAAGPVFSYYEFKHPMADRLTDGAWLNILYSKEEPNRPKWYQPLMQQIDEPSDDDNTGMKKLTDTYFSERNPDWSPDGEKIAFERNFNIYVMNTDGSELQRITYDTNSNSDPAWSPDGERIAFISQSDIFIMNADGSNPQDLTNSPEHEGDPCWSPDGQKIAYMSRAARRVSGMHLDYNIYVMNADGSEPVQLTDNPEYDGDPHWSPDGQKIMYASESVKERNYDIFIMNPDGSQKENLTDSPAYDSNPCGSPDGENIAFVSRRDTNYDIYVMNADGSDQRRFKTNPNYITAGSPSWSPDSKQIVCVCGDYTNLDIYIMDFENAKR